MRTPRTARRPFVPHSERLRQRLAPIREARLQRVIRDLHHSNNVLGSVAEELALSNVFDRCRDEIHGEFSQAMDLTSLMEAGRKALENLGPDSQGPAKAWGDNFYRYSNRSSYLWSVARDKLQGESRLREPTLILPGEKRYFINTGKDRGFPENKTDILVVDRLVDFEKMGPEDRAWAEADFESDLQNYFGEDYRIKYADRLDQLKEALRYNLYVRWPGFDPYDVIIMANKHVRNAQRIKDDLPPEPLFHSKSIEELVLGSLRGLQKAFTNKLIAVENARRNELHRIRNIALDELRTALDQGKTSEELIRTTLDMLPKLFPRSPEESYLTRGSMSIMTFDEQEKVLKIADARGLTPEIIRDTRIHPGQTIAGKVFETGEALLIPDITALPEMSANRTSSDRAAKGSAMIVPIATEHKTYGLLSVSSDHPKAFREEELSFARKIAAILADKMLRLSLQKNIERLARFDDLTLIMLRRGPGEEKLNEILEVARKKDIPLAFLMLDLDHFKRVNDTLGHRAGDQLLKGTAQVIRDFIQGHQGELQDWVDIRWGGDELVVGLLGINKKRAQELAEELRERIKQNICEFYGEEIRATASIGIAVYPAHGRSVEDLSHNADKALYRAKEEGRDQSRVYDPQDRRMRDSINPD
jgi:diguanylate cyclase (GGDEF)-like protein